MAPLTLTIITYTTRYILKKDLYSCWFEPSIYDWILHGPNVILQIVIRKSSFFSKYLVVSFSNIYSLIFLFLIIYVFYLFEN